jgi:hypothetical protein
VTLINDGESLAISTAACSTVSYALSFLGGNTSKERTGFSWDKISVIFISSACL